MVYILKAILNQVWACSLRRRNDLTRIDVYESWACLFDENAELAEISEVYFFYFFFIVIFYTCYLLQYSSDNSKTFLPDKSNRSGARTHSYAALKNEEKF